MASSSPGTTHICVYGMMHHASPFSPYLSLSLFLPLSPSPPPSLINTHTHAAPLQPLTWCCHTPHSYLQQRGWDVTYLPVQQDGRVDVAELAAALRPDTALVSVMAVNNEIGVRQPLNEIAALCRSSKVFFHTDAAQAVGKVPMDVGTTPIDLMSISGHKLYGPKGVGALYVRRRPRVRLEAQMSGGGQERGLRSGTVPTAAVVGLGAACEVAAAEMAADHAHIRRHAPHSTAGVSGLWTMRWQGAHTVAWQGRGG